MFSRRRRLTHALILAGFGVGFGGCAGNHIDTGSSPSDDRLLPARVRRLTNAEYAASVWALLGADTVLSVGGFPRDTTQKLGFTVNDAQLVSSVLAGQLDSSAQGVVAWARESGRLAALAPCGDLGPAETCARTFIESFAAQAYRRPLAPEDIEPLLELFRAGTADGGSYDEGIDLVTRAILQSPGFIYVTELGDGDGVSAGRGLLTPYETASVLSYVATAAPPDQSLLDDVGALVTPTGRERHLRRLLSTPDGHTRLVRGVREWLGIDGIAEIDKDSTAYPSFTSDRDAMAAESISFIDEVLGNGAGTLQELLGAEWTIIGTANGATSEQISTYYWNTYGLGPGGSERTALGGALGGTRVGILNQGAFLSRFATATGSNPVSRGVAVMRRLACLELPDPVEVDVSVIPPGPDPRTPKTTRERYSAHATDGRCMGCHQTIDGFGFAFELYDGVGAFRINRQEAVKTATGTVMLPVESWTTVAGTGTDLDGDYPDSNALARALSTSATARVCMARQLFRASAGRGDASVRGAEDAFVAEWQQLPIDRQSNPIETLVAFVRSDVFVKRRTPP